MDSKELLKKVRQVEIKSRRLSDNVFGGEYLSTFKGRGMTFSEVRKYESVSYTHLTLPTSTSV